MTLRFYSSTALRLSFRKLVETKAIDSRIDVTLQMALFPRVFYSTAKLIRLPRICGFYSRFGETKKIKELHSCINILRLKSAITLSSHYVPLLCSVLSTSSTKLSVLLFSFSFLLSLFFFNSTSSKNSGRLSVGSSKTWPGHKSKTEPIGTNWGYQIWSRP